MIMKSPKLATDNRFKKINQKLPLKSNNVEFLRYCGGHFENGDRKKFFDVGNQFRMLKSNNVEFVRQCGGHFENGDW